MVSVSTRTDSSHRFLFVTLKVELTKIDLGFLDGEEAEKDRKSTRLNSSHANISYANSVKYYLESLGA